MWVAPLAGPAARRGLGKGNKFEELRAGTAISSFTKTGIETIVHPPQRAHEERRDKLIHQNRN